jgi:hypothetical protein
MLSYRDAIAYCDWAGTRLASEAQVMSAALVDERECDQKDMDEGMRERLKGQIQEGKVTTSGTVVTSTLVPSGSVVVRRAHIFLLKGWQSRAKYHRFLRPLDYYDIMTEFLVCKER